MATVTANQSLSAVEKKMKTWQPSRDIPEWFVALRHEARDAYFDLEMPANDDERWHYGKPQSFSLDGLDIAHSKPGFEGISYERICGLSQRPSRVTCLSMIGTSVNTISSSSPLLDAGVTVMTFRQAITLRSGLLEQFLADSRKYYESDKLLASHFALIDNGFFVYLPKGVKAPEPIHMIMESGESGSVVSPHVLVVAEKDSSADVFVHYLGKDSETRNLQLGMISSTINQSASVTVSKIEHVGNKTDIFTRENAQVHCDGRYISNAVHLGGHHIRHEAIINLLEPDGHAEIHEMHLTRGKQRYDFYTEQNHHAPSCYSNLLFKGALLDRGRASYLGAVNVAPKAYRTDAYQASRTLVLSPNARADSSPQLQIQANDVRCSHGATVSNVDDRMLFYLMSRGMSESRARSLIVSGFVAEIADKLPLETARDYVYNFVLERI